MALGPSLAVSPFGPLEGPRDVFTGAFLYQLEAGKSSALVAVRPCQLAHGRRLDVVGLASLGDRWPAQALALSMDDLAAMHGADQLAMCTQRAHLVKGATRHGWQMSGVVLTKGFHRVQQ